MSHGDTPRTPDSETVPDPEADPAGRSEKPSRDLEAAAAAEGCDAREGSVHKRTLPIRPNGVVVVQSPRRGDSVEKGNLSDVPPETAQRDSYVGTLIDGRYAVEAFVGEGAMGLVYRGRHLAIDKVVAIKVMRTDLVGDREASMRFLTEARAASAVGSAHIADVTDFGILPDGSTFIVMEYLRGITLAELLEAQRRLAPLRLLTIAAQIAEGLGDAHDAGIIHRDLKPENVFLVSRKGTDVVKILDFGIAKIQRCKNRVTRTGQVFGTPHYMSPEQAMGGVLDHRADLYALGAIMYEMATGHVPFDGDNPMTVLSRHLHESPMPPSARAPAGIVSPGLEAVILKCLAKRPQHRYGSAIELLHELRTLSSGGAPQAWTRDTGAQVPRRRWLDGTSHPSTPPPSSRARSRTKSRLTWVTLAALLATGLGIAAIGLRDSPTAVLRPLFAYGATDVARATYRAAPQIEPGFSWSEAAGTRPVALLLSPLDAEVMKDGKSLGGMPITVRVPIGQTVTVLIRRDGYESRSVVIDDAEDRRIIRLSAVPVEAERDAALEKEKAKTGRQPGTAEAADKQPAETVATAPAPAPRETAREGTATAPGSSVTPATHGSESSQPAGSSSNPAPPVRPPSPEDTPKPSAQPPPPPPPPDAPLPADKTIPEDPPPPPPPPAPAPAVPPGSPSNPATDSGPTAQPPTAPE